MSGRVRGRVRIVGGRWRRRLLRVAERPQLRPTPDRIRETLFNWIGPKVEGMRCADLFAGTGALGFEAVSRGAAAALLLEQDPRACEMLLANARSLGADNVWVVCADALAWLDETRVPRTHDPDRGAAGAEAFDLVFLDPPFRDDGLLQAACGLLQRHRWLAPDALVYIETGSESLDLPAAWRMLRCGKAGQVRYHLATCPAGD